MARNLFERLNDLFDLMAGGQTYQPLPDEFFNQPDWDHASKSLALPAAWRRQVRVLHH
jgi:hypothetical protein